MGDTSERGQVVLAPNPTLHTTSATGTKVVLAPNSDAQLGGLHTPTFYTTAGAQSGARLWFTVLVLTGWTRVEQSGVYNERQVSHPDWCWL